MENEIERLSARISLLEERVDKLENKKKPPKSYNPQDLINSSRSDHRIIGHHMLLYKEDTGRPYIPTFGRDCKLIKDKLDHMTEETYLRIQALYFSKRKDREWFWSKADPTIPNFTKRMNETLRSE